MSDGSVEDRDDIPAAGSSSAPKGAASDHRTKYVKVGRSLVPREKWESQGSRKRDPGDVPLSELSPKELLAKGKDGVTGLFTTAKDKFKQYRHNTKAAEEQRREALKLKAQQHEARLNDPGDSKGKKRAGVKQQQRTADWVADQENFTSEHSVASSQESNQGQRAFDAIYGVGEPSTSRSNNPFDKLVKQQGYGQDPRVTEVQETIAKYRAGQGNERDSDSERDR
jgi:hypothetical protein